MSDECICTDVVSRGQGDEPSGGEAGEANFEDISGECISPKFGAVFF